MECFEKRWWKSEKFHGKCERERGGNGIINPVQTHITWSLNTCTLVKMKALGRFSHSYQEFPTQRENQILVPVKMLSFDNLLSAINVIVL